MNENRIENFARCHDGTIKCQFVCTFSECQKKIGCIYKEYGRGASKKIKESKEDGYFRRPAWYFSNVKAHLLQHFEGRPEADLPNTSSSVEVDIVDASSVGNNYEIITTYDAPNSIDDEIITTNDAPNSIEDVADNPSCHEESTSRYEQIQNDDSATKENTAAHKTSCETHSAMSKVNSGIRKEAGSLVKRMVEKFTKDDCNNGSDSDCSLSCSILFS